MVHYSSNTRYYEGGAKNPLNGTYDEVSGHCASLPNLRLGWKERFWGSLPWQVDVYPRIAEA